MQLFQRNGTRCLPIEQWLAPMEDDIHQLIGANLEPLLGVRLLGHEIETTDGRMDSLGIDQFGGPVIIEFKRGRKDNIINQALSYQLWLDQHRERYEALLRQTSQQTVDWTALRIICIASAFSSYDKQSISLFRANIDLVEYALFGQDLIGLNQVASHRLPGYGKLQRNKLVTPKTNFEQLASKAPIETQQRLHHLVERLHKAHPSLSISPREDRLELIQGDCVAHLRFQGTSILRLKALVMMTPEEIRSELDSCWWPGLDTYRRKTDAFEMSLFDMQSIEAFMAIMAASLRLKERADGYY